MSDGPLNISKDLMVGQLDFSLYLKLEKNNLAIPQHEVRFIPRTALKKNESLDAVIKNNFSPEDIIDTDYSDSIIIIALAGKFYSLDKFKLKSLKADSTGIRVWLSYVSVESQDGDPFPVTPFLIIPVTRSVTKYKRLTIEFEGWKQHFLTGREQEDSSIAIPKVEFLFH